MTTSGYGGSFFMGLTVGVVWESWSAERLEQARRQQQRVIVDFYASWCAPCRELDKIVFHHPDVVERSRRFLMIKVDLTRGGVALHDALVAQYDIRGVPTILFLVVRPIPAASGAANPGAACCYTNPSGAPPSFPSATCPQTVIQCFFPAAP